MEPLPVHAVREAFDRAGPRARLVISSPTGSGKSTEVPRWCDGRVLVVEPRRVACRALAARVSQLEGTPTGTTVGYRVRDDRAESADTRILYCTPGVVLRAWDEVDRFGTIILDEFHERSMETDLLLALLLKRFNGRLVAMSATVDAQRVATHMKADVLAAAGRTFPITIHHVPGDAMLPTEDGLMGRIHAALRRAASDAGDILVFLPGKAEIAACARTLETERAWDVLMLHGDLSMEQQQRVFAPSARRKVILATNVAETSLTLPGVGVVVDSGLARQTRYHRGRGHLALVPVAQDSADQRAGRAGRTGPGVAYRLWSAAARLAPVTLPEVLRESVVPLVLAAAAWGEPADALPLLDAPPKNAMAAAQQDLLDLGAVDADTRITPTGRELFGLPLDPWLGRLLVEAGRKGCPADAVDLAAALSTNRAIFMPPSADGDDLRADGCDATALITALRSGQPGVHPLVPHALEEARRMSDRLRRAQGLPPRTAGAVQRHRLAMAAMAADPRSAHVSRKHGGRTAWTSGGAEAELARHSAVNALKDVEALVVLDTHAASHGHGDNTLRITCAMPVQLQWLRDAGLGTDRLEAVTVERGKIVATLERVHAGKTLATRQDVPTGEAAREAMKVLFVRGSIFKGAFEKTRERLELGSLWARLVQSGVELDLYGDHGPPPPVQTLEAFAEARIRALGVESGDDLQMLSAADFTAPDIPDEVRELLGKAFPRSIRAGDATYTVEYDPASRTALLRGGNSRSVPSATFLPRMGGFRVVVEQSGVQRVVRAR